MNKRVADLLAVAVCAGICTASAFAEDSAPNLWDQFKSVVTLDSEQDSEQAAEQFKEVLRVQDQLLAEEQLLQEQREQGRQLRVMRREASMLIEGNIAWLFDTLDNFRCRLADQKVLEVEFRVNELIGFEQSLDTLCMDLGDDAGHQQRACERQRTDLAQAVRQLDELGRRYATTCSTAIDQPIQIGGERPWQ